MKYSALLLALLLTPACVDEDTGDDDAEPAVATTAQALTATPRADVPVTTLATGRMTKVPATEPWWIDVPYTSTGASVSLRTFDCDALDDTAMLVRWIDPVTGKTISKFNDDAPLGQTDTNTSKNSFVNLGAPPAGQSLTLKVTVASRKPTTANCRLEMFSGGTTSIVGGKHTVGGLLVDVGAMQQNDFVEVQTRKNGTLGWYIDRTNLLLFDVGTPGNIEDDPDLTYTGKYTPYYAFAQDTDNDPKITISGQDRSDVRSYVILGKVGSASTENRNVVYWVDLMHGPFRKSMRRAAWLNAGGGGATDWVVLTPGRYVASIRAKVSMAIGECSAAGNEPACQPSDPRVLRGRFNDRAFSYTVERDKSGTLANVENIVTREVPLGAFGMKDAYHRFYVEFDVPFAAHYRFSTSNFASDVTFEPSTGVELIRNLPTTEFKVAASNLYYHDEGGGVDNAANEMGNAGHLLMLRGWVDKVARRVRQRPADNIEMQADVVAMTEVANLDNFHETMDEANNWGSLRWNYKGAVDEEMASDGYGAVFVNDNFWPSYDDPDSIRRPAIDTATSYCVYPEDVECTYQACSAGANGCGIYSSTWHADLDAIPVKMVIDRRGDSSNIPVVVVGSHFTVAGMTDRASNAINTMRLLAALQYREPTAFNTAGSTDPLYSGNRIIVVGDLNMETTTGEGYQIVRSLREKYGFALDIAQGISAVGLDGEPPRGGSIYGAYGGYNYSAAIQAVSPFLPVPYQDFYQWDALNPASKFLVPFANRFPLLQQYATHPWWATTWYRNTHRHDAVILVGKGWLNDDAARDYLVTQMNLDNTQGDPDRANPFRVYAENGKPIALCLNHETGNQPCSFPSDYIGYAPWRQIYGGANAGGNPGDEPMNTDHKPILARVRTVGPTDAEAERLYFKRQKQYGTTGWNANPQKGQDVVYDTSGNKYLVGSYGAGGLPAMGGACTTALTSAGGTDMFIAKVDAQNNCVWQKGIGGTGNDRAWSVAVDPSGTKVYVSGGFEGSVDFDPGAVTNTFTASGGLDAFLLALDSAGNWQWTKTVGDVGSDFGSGVAVDFLGKVWWAGYFNWASTVTRTIGACQVTGTGTGDSFWAAFDSAGTAQAAPKCGALTGPGNQYVYAIAAAKTGGDVVLAGMYDTAFTAGTQSVPAPAGSYDIFGYGLQGPATNHAVSFGSAAWDQANTIAVEGANFYIGGFVSGSVSNFGGGCAASTANPGYTDGIVVGYADLGNCLWTSRVGGTGSDWVQAVEHSPAGLIVVANYDSPSITAGPKTHNLPGNPGKANVLFYTVEPWSGAITTSRSFEYTTTASWPTEGRGVATFTQNGLTRIALTGFFAGLLDTGAGPYARLDAGGNDTDVFVSEYENP